MLTVKQPTTYGFKSVHDLPTPPSSSRHSPPLLSYQDHPHSLRQLPGLRRSLSPPSQPMSGSHRSLPPPGALTLPPQQPPPAGAPLPTHHHGNPPQQPQPQQPLPPQQQQPPPPQQQTVLGHHSQPGQLRATLPPPHSQWQEESLRGWLQARSEEERTKQEEERTKQENIRLEQRKLEMDLLQHSLRGGIPPPMIPLVFAGMGRDGTVPQSVLEWAQQFMHGPQSHYPQLMPPRPGSPQHQRDQPIQGHGQYPPPPPAAVAPSGASAPQGPPGYPQHPNSPNRSRPMAVGHPILNQNLPSLNTNLSISHQGPGNHMHAPSAQQDPSPGIYFHHWQPPASHSTTGSNRPASPSGEGPRKRKATGPQHSNAAPSDQRLRSPPPFSQPTSSSSSRRGHKRQKSDISWYQSASSTQDRGDDHSERPSGPSSPNQTPRPTISRERSRSEVGKHSVSSMLSAEPNESSEEHLRPWQASGDSASYYGPSESDQRARHGGSGVESQRNEDHSN